VTELKVEIKLFLILCSVQFYKNKVVCFVEGRFALDSSPYVPNAPRPYGLYAP